MTQPIVDEAQFLRDLVKSSRQRTIQVSWTDRDGTKRHTALTPVEATRLNGIASARKVSASEVLRQAAHIPVQPLQSGGPRQP